MARAGDIRCHGCGTTIQQQTSQQIRDTILELPPETKLMLLSPIVTGRKGAHKEVFNQIRKERLVRVRVDGEVHDIDRVPELDVKKPHTIEAVTDRIIIREGITQRLTEGIDLATKLGGGAVIVSYLEKNSGDGPVTDWQEQIFSTIYACPDCHISYTEVEPRTFSFNSPYGACPDCQGIGSFTQFDPELVIPDKSKSIDTSAIAPWNGLSKTRVKKQIAQIEPLLRRLNIDQSTRLDSIADTIWNEFLFSREKTSPGLLVILEKELATTAKEERQETLENFQSNVGCNTCRGSRLNQQANSVFLADKNMVQITSMSIDESFEYFETLAKNGQLDRDQSLIAEPLFVRILHRLTFLRTVGVGYLTLDRPGTTLSGGELQRVRLATSIGSGLTNVCYVLDEPSIGLHPRDNDRLIKAIRALQDSGNSIVVVEHDEEMIRSADQIIDIGPEAGADGGLVVATGTAEEVALCQASLTGDYLSGRRSIKFRKRTREFDRARCLKLSGASGFNLKNVDVTIPLGLFTCVTGVSGSGKSTLINSTLARAISGSLGLFVPKPAEFRSLTGIENIDKIIHVDQKPIGKTARGCAATYTGVFDEFRKLFAATKMAKERGYSATRFSFNAKEGRCTDCLGHGIKRIKMNFLSDMFVECQTCGGKRFNQQTLQVRFRSLTIADVLELSVRRAIKEFENFSKIQTILKSLDDVGLGYLPLGQPSTTLSGGEAQRIKLATELAKKNTGNTLYLLDEPTTGLHFEDIRGLLLVLNQLVDLGNTVIVIEHNLDVIKSADWIIDLGPDGGINGGEIVAEGKPETVAGNESSITGRYLQELV